MMTLYKDLLGFIRRPERYAVVFSEHYPTSDAVAVKFDGENKEAHVRVSDADGKVLFNTSVFAEKTITFGVAIALKPAYTTLVNVRGLISDVESG
jgi:hypothetical protein